MDALTPHSSRGVAPREPAGQSGSRGGRAARAERSAESEALFDPEGTEPDADPVEVAKQIVLTQLTASAKSRHQLEQVLAKRGVPSDAAAVALDRFTELGYLDDAAFARAWVESRQRSRGLATSALRRELRSKGIDAELAEQVLADTVDDDQQRATASALVSKKLRSMRGVDADTAMRRLVSMLARKGYPPGMAYAVVRAEISTSHTD